MIDFSNPNIRFKLTPQMHYYDRLGMVWNPFLMFFHTPNFVSKVVNTDEYGLRCNHFLGKTIYPLKGNSFKNETSVIIGGSTAFGVGASSDGMTISSKLSNLTKINHINMGGRAYSSSQELILFSKLASKLKNIKHVIIFSGLNDLHLSSFGSDDKDFGYFYYMRKFKNAMDLAALSKKQLLIRFFLYPFYKDSITYNSIDMKEFLKLLFSIKSIKQDNKPIVNINYAISQLEKNLFIWKQLSKAYPFKLTFILQPLSIWLEKELSQEENCLFKYLDSVSSSQNLISLFDKNIYKEYTVSLDQLCKKLGISYFDSNKILKGKLTKNDWIFTDRAHLTDLGNEKVSDMINSIIS